MDANNPLIWIDKNSCKKCYACLRACPVNAIVLKKNDDYPTILNNRCIGCGSCYTFCSPNSIKYRDGKSVLKELFGNGEKVAAIVAPSISGEFDDIADYRKFVGMIRKLGFNYVNEVSFGVDLVSRKYKELFETSKGKYYITANCPSVVSYVEKFRTELIDNLAPIISPMIATAKLVREVYGKEIKVVFIGPCIATKDEALLYDDDGKVDAVLTFKELRELFAEFNITESKLEYSDFDPPIGQLGSLYPLSRGILEASGIEDSLQAGEVITTEGKTNMMHAVNQFDHHIEKIKSHFNIFYNEGCLMGPGMKLKGEKFLRRALVVQYANKRLKKFDRKSWEEAMEKFIDLDFDRGFVNDDQRLPTPSNEKVREVMKAMNKKSMDEELGCANCGYESCKDFAVTVAKGLARTDMCITYTLKNRQEYIKALKVSNEKLASAQAALKESEKKARREQQAAKEASERITHMLQKLPSGVVIVDNQLKIIESNESFIDILGEDVQEINDVIPGLKGADLKTLLPTQFYKLFEFVIENDKDVINKDVQYGENLFNVSIFTIKKSKVVGAVIRDMYLPEVRKEEVIKRVSDAIDDNLKMVQNIGFLLGENASQVEKKLNSIIESHKTDKKIKE